MPAHFPKSSGHDSSSIAGEAYADVPDDLVILNVLTLDFEEIHWVPTSGFARSLSRLLKAIS